MEAELALTLPDIENHLDLVASRVWFPPACSRKGRENDEKTMKKRWRAISLLFVLGSIVTLVATWNLPENDSAQLG